MSDRFRGTPAPDPADLSAVFVSDGADDKVGIAALVGGVGADALRFPAVLVPQGAAPPGYPFVEFGEMHGDGERGSSRRKTASGPGLHADRSSTHARSQTPPARQGAEGVAASGLFEAGASDDARLGGPAGSPPAMARDPQGQLHDYAADAISAALHALAVPPTYDSLSELVDLAIRATGLQDCRGCHERERRA